MLNQSAISFGDNVRVRVTPLTKELELAGSVGQVYGETIPSVTGVRVIGGSREDMPSTYSSITEKNLTSLWQNFLS